MLVTRKFVVLVQQIKNTSGQVYAFCEDWLRKSFRDQSFVINLRKFLSDLRMQIKFRPKINLQILRTCE
jgi:hypothetical protein